MGVHLDDVRKREGGKGWRGRRGGWFPLKLPLSEAECILRRRDGRSKDII